MPRYTEPSDLITLLSQRELTLLTSDDVDDPTVVEGIVAEYLASAESLVEAAVGNRYRVPFNTPIPPVLRMAILIIAKYGLFLRRGFVEDAVRRDYEDQVNLLRSIRLGEYDLPVDDDMLQMDVRSGFGEMVNMEFFNTLFE